MQSKKSLIVNWSVSAGLKSLSSIGPAKLWAPVLAPIPRGAYEMTSIGFSLVGTTTRTLSLSWEGAFAGRNTARGYHYTTEDHAKLIGAANPSLTYAPMDGRQTEKLF